jgi:D-alanyl-D-alanine carboxypeptidase (penicillin-binding protein 5/6)
MMRRLFGLFVSWLILMTVGALALDSDAPRVVVHEESTGSLLIARDEDKPIAPANFAKLMTAAVVFEALATREITDATVFEVSEHAWRTGGAPARVTTMFAAVRSYVAVSDLLKGLIVDYGNDAAIVLAEGLSGSEAAFTERMNAYAAKIGLASTRFANPTGYPDAASKTTLADVLTLVGHIRVTYPDRYGLYALADFDWNKIRQTNKTRQVRDIPGAEGMMLAYDDTDGFAGVVTVTRGDRHLVVAVSGLKSIDDRDKELKRLVDSAFADYGRYALFPGGAEVGRVRVFGGVVDDVAVTGAGVGPVAMTLPTADRTAFRLAIVYDGPVPAPVKKGQRLARLVAYEHGRVYQSVPLEAAADVETGDLRTRAVDGLYELFVGWWRDAFALIDLRKLIERRS